MKCPNCDATWHGKRDYYFCANCGSRSERRPNIELLAQWDYEDGGCETPCGCWVEVDGHCEHGNPSWALLVGLI